MNQPGTERQRKPRLLVRPHFMLPLAVAMIAASVLTGLTFFRDSFAGTFQCFGEPFTVTAESPTSAIEGSTVTLKNITGSGDTLGFTVTKVTITFSVTGATPLEFSKTWTGSVAGAYTANFGDQQLSVTGTAGSTLEVKVISVSSDVEGIGNFTCTGENGYLTTDGEGETAVLASIPIKAQTSSSPSSSSGSSQSTQTESSSEDSSTPEAKSDSQAANESLMAETEAMDQDPIAYPITITVVNKKGQPEAVARVVLDSRPPLTTGADGKVNFADVTVGSHNVSISAHNNTNTHVIEVREQEVEAPQEFTLTAPAASILKRVIALAPYLGGLLVLSIAGAVTWLVRRHRRAKRLAHAITDSSAVQPLPETGPTQSHVYYPGATISPAEPSLPEALPATPSPAESPQPDSSAPPPPSMPPAQPHEAAWDEDSQPPAQN